MRVFIDAFRNQQQKISLLKSQNKVINSLLRAQRSNLKF